MVVKVAIAITFVLATACSQKQASPPPPATAALPAESPRPESKGLIGRGDTELTILGVPLEVGAKMPSFDLADLAVDPATGAPRHLDSSSLAGKVIAISVVPSIDTTVCEQQTGKMVEQAPNLPPGVEV